MSVNKSYASPDSSEHSPSPGEDIDLETFNQILELDEDDTNRDFSESMVWAYFDQAKRTFGEMDDALYAA